MAKRSTSTRRKTTSRRQKKFVRKLSKKQFALFTHLMDGGKSQDESE